MIAAFWLLVLVCVFCFLLSGAFGFWFAIDTIESVRMEGGSSKSVFMDSCGRGGGLGKGVRGGKSVYISQLLDCCSLWN